MQKHIAFALYKRNEQGAHQPTIERAAADGVEVYLASEVDARIKTLTAGLLAIDAIAFHRGPDDDDYRDIVAKVTRSLMVT